MILWKSINNCNLQIVYKYSAADLKAGKVYRGEPEKGIKADTTLTIDDSDMIDLVSIKVYY